MPNTSSSRLLVPAEILVTGTNSKLVDQKEQWLNNTGKNNEEDAVIFSNLAAINKPALKKIRTTSSPRQHV